MAYTKAQAREYYFNYTKKGKRKGRKKGRGRKKSSSSISKEQRARCNNECKAIRERIKAEKKDPSISYWFLISVFHSVIT